MGYFFKSLFNLLQYCSCFVCVCGFGRKARGISAPQSGTNPAAPTLELKVLTNGPPGKSQKPTLKIGKHKLVQSERVGKKDMP